MADIVRALARVRNGEHDTLLPAGVVEEACRGIGVVFRERVFTPLVTVRLFLMQILAGNTSITHLRTWFAWLVTPVARRVTLRARGGR